MKKSVQTFRTVLVLLAAIVSWQARSQCVASFSYNINANGQVSFANTSSGTNSTTTYYWNFGNSQTYSATGTPGAYPVHQYTANGVYIVTLTFVTASPSCSAATQQTVIISNVVGPCVLNANFTVAYFANGQVNFYNTTTGTVSATTYTWSFGNNSYAYTTNASHTYSVNGSYVATLTAANNATCTSTKTLMVTVTSNTCLANFSYSVLPNGTVNFTSTSVPATSLTLYFWKFGNGSTFSDTGNVYAATSYTAVGSYSVTLYVDNPGCADSVTKVINTLCPLNAGFTHTQVSNGLVFFSNASGNTYSASIYTWRFGDGTSSALENPAHTYTANGSYQVLLKVKNHATCEDSVQTQVNITSVCSMAASFAHTVGTGGNVTFSNTSVGSGTNPSCTWWFGDGTAGSGQAPFHTYTNGGAHLVTLKVSNGSCADSLTMSVNITGISCSANSGFSLVPTGTPKHWNAIPSYPYNVTAAKWHWGDGSVSNSLYTTHQYTASGTYLICLSLTVSCGDTSTTCSSNAIYRTAGDIYQVNVVSPELKPVGITVQDVIEPGPIIYPNPNKGSFSIRGETGLDHNSGIRIYNVVGESIYEGRMEINSDGVGSVELGTLPAGFYCAEILSPKGTYLRRFVIAR